MQVRSLSALAAAPLLLCGGPLAHLPMELWCVHVAQRGKRREHPTLHAVSIAPPLSLERCYVMEEGRVGEESQVRQKTTPTRELLVGWEPPCCRKLQVRAQLAWQ